MLQPQYTDIFTGAKRGNYSHNGIHPQKDTHSWTKRHPRTIRPHKGFKTWMKHTKATIHPHKGLKTWMKHTKATIHPQKNAARH